MPLPSPDFWYGVLVTAVFSFIAYWIGIRRRRVTLTHHVVPMIPKGGEKLAVTWAGEEVRYPRIVQVQLESSGAGDITPANFEGGGIYLDLIKGTAIGALQTDDAPPASVADCRVTIEPFLLKKGKTARMNFLASGENLAIDASRSTLAEASVAVMSREERWWRILLGGAVIYALTALGGLLAVTLPILKAIRFTLPGGEYTSYAALLVVSMGTGIFAIVKIRGTRRRLKSPFTDAVGSSQPLEDRPVN